MLSNERGAITRYRELPCYNEITLLTIGVQPKPDPLKRRIFTRIVLGSRMRVPDSEGVFAEHPGLGCRGCVPAPRPPMERDEGHRGRLQHRVVLRDATGPVDARIASVHIARDCRPGVLCTVLNPLRVRPGDGG
jgi:hypothetical protein